MNEPSRPLDPQTALLFQKFLADRLNGDEAARLLHAFDNEPGLAEFLFQQILIDDRLHDLYHPSARPSAETVGSGEATSFFADSSFPQTPLPPRLLHSDILSATAAKSGPAVPVKAAVRRPLIPTWLLTCVLITLFVWASFHELRPLFVSGPATPQSPEPSYLGRVTATADARSKEAANPWIEGRRFDSEKIVLESGTIELTLENGVRIVLEGPTEYHQQSLGKSYCSSGRLSVEVPPTGHGFEVATPGMTVRDLGTEFVIDVTERGSEVHVVKGDVEAHWLTKDWFPLSEGRGLDVRAGEAVRQIVADSDRFVSQKRMVQKAFDATERRQKRNRTFFYRDNADPGLLVRLDFDTFAGQSVGARTVQGRWQGDKAVECRDKNDRIEVDVPGTFPALTLLATVRLDGSDRACNTILATDLFTDRDGFCWNIENSGRLQLQYLEPGSRTARLYESEPCLSPKFFETWIDLAVSIDTANRKIVHYFNGRPVAESTMETAAPIRLDRLTVGNWIRRARAPVGRQFQGRIDSLTVFSRILTDQEIQKRIYE